jgi:uncharacterized protein YqhQ
MVEIDEKTLELANKAIDQTNSLNKHCMTCFSIVLCVGFIVFGLCNMYSTYKTYDYDFNSVNTNINRNINENGGNQ